MAIQVQVEREGDTQLIEDIVRFLKKHPNFGRFVLNPAGATFILGWFLALGILIGWLGIVIIDPATGANMMLMVITEFIAGREVAIPLGIVQLGLPVLIVFGIAFTQDLVTTTWFYPLFYTFRRRQRSRKTFWGYFFRRMEKQAEEHREKIQKYGAVGLFFFMLIPFAINGPLIGAIIGKLAGIRTRYILPTVVLATATATGGWTLAWAYFRPQAEWFVDAFGGRWIAVGIVVIFVLVIGKTVIGFLRDLRAYKRIERRREEIARRLKAGTVVQVLRAEASRDAAAQAETSDAA